MKTSGGAETYDFKGEQRQMDCRDEVFDFSTPATSLPDLIDDPGLPSGSVTERICRTVQGPVQFRGDGVAYARKYAIWNRELETFTGLTELMDSDDIGDVDSAMRHVTWNENVMAVDSAGKIGYWHPGLHPLRPKKWDERLPFPGNGDGEWRGLLPRSKTPHVVNPKRNWLANWNNLPVGRLDQRRRPGARARERQAAPDPPDPVARPQGRQEPELRAQPQHRADQRHDRPAVPVRRPQEAEGGEEARQGPRRGDHRRADALGRQLQRDRRETGPIAPGVSIWEEYKTQLESILLKPYGPGREAACRRHQHLTRIRHHPRRGDRASATSVRRPTRGRRSEPATELAAQFGTDSPAAWRAPRLMYDVTVQGAASPPDLPFFDRGTWSQSLAMGRPGQVASSGPYRADAPDE